MELSVIKGYNLKGKAYKANNILHELNGDLSHLDRERKKNLAYQKACYQRRKASAGR